MFSSNKKILVKIQELMNMLLRPSVMAGLRSQWKQKLSLRILTQCKWCSTARPGGKCKLI